MSQSNILTRERATYLGLESSFGTTPAGSYPTAMTRCFPTGEGLVVDGLSEEMLQVMDERVRRLDAIQPVHGLRIGTKVKPLKFNLKAVKTANQLTQSHTVGQFAETLALLHAFGAVSLNGGSTVATGTSTTQFDVATGYGVQFVKGTFVLVENSSHEMEWTKVTLVATDTITVSPALSGTPATGAIVRNLYSFNPSESNTSSLTVQQAFVGDSAAQYTFNGAYGGVTFDLPEFGKIPTMSLGLSATNFTTGDQSISTATASDAMGPSYAWTPSVYFATSVSRASTLVCEGATIEFTNEWSMVRDPSATQTVSAVVATSGRPVAVKASLKLRFDAAYPPTFTTDTDYHLVIVQKIGTGIHASFWLWELAVARLVEVPQPLEIGKRLHYTLMVNGYEDTTLADGGETGDALDARRACIRVAFG